MVDNVGQQDGEATLSELHDREVKGFTAQMERLAADTTNQVAWAGRSFAMAEIYKALALAIQAATVLGTVAGIRALVKWW